jgi:hypothetical protein
MSKPFSITRTFQGIRNFFGFRLRGYEKVIKRGIEAVTKEAHDQYKIKWWRLSVNPLAKGAAMITIYGEYDE